MSGSRRSREPRLRFLAHARETVGAPRRPESKRHLFVVGSLDKHMQNEKGLIRLRRGVSAKGGGKISKSKYGFFQIRNN